MCYQIIELCCFKLLYKYSRVCIEFPKKFLRIFFLFHLKKRTHPKATMRGNFGEFFAKIYFTGGFVGLISILLGRARGCICSKS